MLGEYTACSGMHDNMLSHGIVLDTHKTHEGGLLSEAAA